MPGRYALVVGIDAYDSARWEPLAYCESDAEAVAAVLSMTEYDFQVVPLLDDEATKQNIVRHLLRFRDLSPDLLAFFFAGHGVTTELGSFLVTYDNQEYDEGVSLGTLAELLALPNGSSVAILDSCRSGAAQLLDRKRRGLDRLAFESAFASDLQTSRAVLTACGPAEDALETASRGHGLFSYYVLEGLTGNAADYKGEISLHSLYDYITRPFAELGQTPIFRGDVSGRLVLARGFPPQLGKPIEEEVSADLENRAEELLDGYGALVSASYAEWRESGYLEASQKLEPIYEWFQRQSTKYPGLLRRNRFKNLTDSLTSRVAQLGSIDVGTHVHEGILAEPLGKGAFGTVWRVVPYSSGSAERAYKVYHANELHDLDKVARFRRGFDAMLQLNHPRVVKVHRFTQCPLGFFMDFIQGPNLRTLAPASALEPYDLIRLLIRVAETVEHAHQRDVIHRDIKPENILCTWNDESANWDPYLTDFDLAWFSTATQVTKEAMGTIFYAAPEQFIDFRTKGAREKRPALDIFSFGQLIYFCVTNQDPEPLKSEQNLRLLEQRAQDWPSADAVAQLLDLYDRLTRRQPADRLQDFGDVISALRDIAGELHPEKLGAVLDPESFKVELVFAFGGGARRLMDGEARFQTTSGKTLVNLSHRERTAGGNRVILEVLLTPTEVVGMPGKDHARLKSLVHQRVDDALQTLPHTRRRAGKSSGYDILLECELQDLTREELVQVRDGLAHVIRELEAVV